MGRRLDETQSPGGRKIDDSARDEFAHRPACSRPLSAGSRGLGRSGKIRQAHRRFRSEMTARCGRGSVAARKWQVGDLPHHRRHPCGAGLRPAYFYSPPTHGPTEPRPKEAVAGAPAKSKAAALARQLRYFRWEACAAVFSSARRLLAPPECFSRRDPSRLR